MCLCCPDMCTAPLDGCHRTRMRGKKRRPRRESHGTACGEKGRSSAWDQGETPVSRDGKCESTKCRTHDERVGGKVTSPASAGGIGLGSCVEGRATGPQTSSRTGACGEPTARPLLDRSAGMRNRTEQNPTPTSVSRLSRRVQESSARSIDRITQREGAYPCWADRSESSARSYAVVPGSGTDPPGFLGGKLWKSLKLNSVSPMTGAGGNGKRPQRSGH